MKKLHFNFKDLFYAPRVAFSLQRIWVNGIGLLASYLVYLIFTYFSLLIGGYSFSAVWYKFGLLPCVFASPVPWYSMAVYIIGFILTFTLILLTNTAVSRVVYMVLRNELFYTWRQAYKFALKKWISIWGALLTFAFMIAFFVIAALVMGLLGRIPFVGELGTALLTIPYIFSALLLLFVGVVFVVGLFIIPAILATADEDALGGVFQSFSITFNQPWRLVIYSLIVAVLEFVGIFVFAAVLKYSFRIFILLFTLGMGPKILVLKNAALHLLDQALPALYGLLQGALTPCYAQLVYLSHHHAVASQLSGSMVVSAYIFAFFLFLVGGAVLAYGEAIGNAGMTLIYILLYKFREDENLLEREDEELAEEEEEKPVSEPEIGTGTEEKEEKSGESEAPTETDEK